MNGFVLINKPAGVTSFKVTGAIKRKTGEKRCGHAGTLDPLATGVLPIMIGRATRLIDLIDDNRKVYKASLIFGMTTDTLDCDGEVLTDQPVNVDEGDIRQALKKFEGEIEQIPPMYSALSKDGVKLYELARKGETIEIPKRDVQIFELDLIEPLDKDNCFSIDVLVSKGTYIRSLARDIGEALGCGATLAALERTATCGFDISDCVALESLNSNNITEKIVSEEKTVTHLRKVSVTEKQAVRFCNGGQLDFSRLHIENISENELFRVKYKDEFLGIGIADITNNRLNIKCIINNHKAVEK